VRIIEDSGPRVAKCGQTVKFTRIVKTDAGMLRIRIESDAYDFQSRAIIERWSGKRWNEVSNIPYASMQTPCKLAYQRCEEATLTTHFEADCSRLLDDAALVLG
jgi:hypothetical protein